MNQLEKLRHDVFVSAYGDRSAAALLSDDEGTFYDEDWTESEWCSARAALAVIDEFCAGLEVVEVAAFPPNKEGPPLRVWREGWPKDPADEINFQFIFVPHKKEPTLLEAAEAHKAAADALYTIATVPEDVSLEYVRTAHALAAAIKKESGE